MIFRETRLPGAYRLTLERHGDERGFFARAFCRREFESRGLRPPVAQANISFNPRKGTLRGLHFQAPPAAEDKLVRCTAGAIYDVVLDLRPGSPTRGEWIGVDLTRDNREMLYVPRGCAHGYQVLEDDTEVFYQVSEFYAPEHERGVRWDDPRFGIEWPLEPTVLSEKDRGWPDWEPDPALEAVAWRGGAG